MKYKEAVQRIRRNYKRNDGYNGGLILCGLVYDPKQLIALEVTKTGFHRANGHRYENEQEMLYYFDNHRLRHFPQVAELVVFSSVVL